MSEITLTNAESRIVEAALNGDVRDPIALVKSAGGDVRTFFKFGRWKGVDFTRSDISRVSFFGADIKDAIFTDEQLVMIKLMNTQEVEKQNAAISIDAVRQASRKQTSSGVNHPTTKIRRMRRSPSTTTPKKRYRQTTLNEAVDLVGVGLHSGCTTNVTIHPASANHGIVFRRMDLPAQPSIEANWRNVIVSPLNTRLSNDAGDTVSTIEHLMGAFSGCGVHNALVDLDSPELPIFDGSAATYARAILESGLKSLDAPVNAIEILKKIEVKDDECYASLEPAESFSIDFSIDFKDEAIGKQQKTLVLSGASFIRELSDSRTFCRSADVDAMRANGLTLGGSIENVVVVDGDKVLTPGGLRHVDEAVRHKMLDVMGDLYTTGAPILGCYTGVRSGHAMTNRLIRALFEDPSAWRFVRCNLRHSKRLPGMGETLPRGPKTD